MAVPRRDQSRRTRTSDVHSSNGVSRLVRPDGSVPIRALSQIAESSSEQAVQYTEASARVIISHWAYELLSFDPWPPSTFCPAMPPFSRCRRHP